MVFAGAFKVYSTVSCRRFMGDLTDAHTKGYLSRLPCYNSIFNYFEMPELTPILRTLIERSSVALKAVETTFAVDSSGFSTYQYTRWYNAKYGREQEVHGWVTVHLMCGVTTNVVTAVEITGRETADVTMFAPLVNATARNFALGDVTADKAYLSRKNLRLVTEHGGTPYIPFKSNTTGDGHGSVLWEDLYHFFMLHRAEFLEHYHRRSLVESTFNMIKAKFGTAIRSKTDVAQVNELLCKVLCHNLCCVIQSMYELGIEPEF
jgi:transposase